MTGVRKGKHDYFLAGSITGLIFLTVLVFLNIWPPFHKVASKTHLRGYHRARPRPRWGKERHLPQGQNVRGAQKKSQSSKCSFKKIYWSRVHLQFSLVQSLSRVRLFAAPWIAARQASLSITNSWSSHKLTSIESVMPSSHLILCRPLLLLPPIPPSVRVFSMSQLFAWGGQRTGVSALASVLPKNTQDWSPLEWTGWISLQSKGLSRVFSNTTVQKHKIFGT